MIWVDAQLSPAIAKWIETDLGLPAQPIRDLGLRDAKDRQIFDAARQANAIVLTKDADFVELVERLGPPGLCG
jgi:predicted nuclease of predicted toxin-antitoxin system